MEGGVTAWGWVEDRAYDGGEVSADAAAVVVEYRHDVAHVGGVRVGSHQFAGSTAGDERSEVGMVEQQVERLIRS